MNAHGVVLVLVHTDSLADAHVEFTVVRVRLRAHHLADVEVQRLGPWLFVLVVRVDILRDQEAEEHVGRQTTDVRDRVVAPSLRKHFPTAC